MHRKKSSAQQIGDDSVNRTRCSSGTCMHAHTQVHSAFALILFSHHANCNKQKLLLLLLFSCVCVVCVCDFSRCMILIQVRNTQIHTHNTATAHNSTGQQHATTHIMLHARTHIVFRRTRNEKENRTVSSITST